MDMENDFLAGLSRLEQSNILNQQAAAQQRAQGLGRMLMDQQRIQLSTNAANPLSAVVTTESGYLPSYLGARLTGDYSREKTSCGKYTEEEIFQIKRRARIAYHKEFGAWPRAVHIVGGPKAFKGIYDLSYDQRMERSALPLNLTKLDIWGARIKHRIVYIHARPIYQKNDSKNGPAVLWSNGEKEYKIDGRKVDPWMVTHPHHVCIKRIKDEENAEIKRLLINKYIERNGYPAFIKGMKATLIHEGERGKLWGIKSDDRSLTVTMTIAFRQTISPYVYTIAEVTNSTPEPDGTYKQYYLTCPSDMETINQAIAWTFEMEEDEYQLAAET